MRTIPLEPNSGNIVVCREPEEILGMDSLKQTLNILHISDLHRGQERDELVWGEVRGKFHKDVLRHMEDNGAIDIVIFSGDITSRGQKKEFSAVVAELQRLWSVFESRAVRPKLLVVPGNHDLVRPPQGDPLVVNALSLRGHPSVRADLFGRRSNAWKQSVKKAFKNYTSFVRALRDTGIDLVLDVEGKIPGDVSGKFSVNGLNVGVVGLNSAWTHVVGGNLINKLDIYPEQLASVVGQDAYDWSRDCHIALLVTHHPEAWLNDAARRDFKEIIFSQAVFDAHLFGHMHEPRPMNLQVGAYTSWSFQAPSLYGLEKIWGDLQRIHGFSFFKFRAAAEEMECWPRVVRRAVMGEVQILADDSMLKESESFKWKWVPNKLEVNAEKK